MWGWILKLSRPWNGHSPAYGDERPVPVVFLDQLHSSILRALRMADALATVIAVFPSTDFGAVNCCEANPLISRTSPQLLQRRRARAALI